MLRATLKSLLSRKVRLLLSGLAVVLATMFVSGAFVLTDTLGRSFDTLFSNVFSTVDIQVSAKPNVGNSDDASALPMPIAKATVDTVKSVPGVDDARGFVLVDGARVIGANGKVVPGTGAPRFGASWSGEDQLIKLRDGHGPEQAGEIAVNAGLAKDGNLKLGDSVSVLTLGPRQNFTLVGIFGYAGGRDSLGGEQTVSFTEPVAQTLMLRQPGAFSGIDVKVADKSTLNQVRDAIRDRLGAGYTVDTGKDLSKKNSDAFKPFLKVFTYVLFGFAVVALLVGIFLILNTFSIIVAQRTQELALLRAMGAGRSQLVGSVMLESFIVGVVASAIGYGVGIGLGALGAFLLAQVFGKLEVASIGTPLIGAVLAFTLGVLVTMVAALLPALRASRVSPMAALRESAATDRPLTRITVSGGIVFALGAGALGFGLSGKAHGNTIWWIFGGVLVCFIGVALLTPLLSKPVVAVLGRLFSWSLPGQLGRRNSARNPRRTAITAAAMMIGIALITAISTLFASLTASINKIVDNQLRADLVIAGQQTSAIPPTIEPSALTQIRGLPQVATVAASSFDAADINGKASFIATWQDLGDARSVLKMQVKSGNIDTLARDEVIMDENTAKGLKVDTGSTLKIRLQRTPEREYRVRGITKDSQIGNGVIVSWAAAQEGFRSDEPVQAFVKLRPGASQAAAKAQVDKILAASPEVTVQTRDEYVNSSTQIFNFLLGAVQVLLLVALAISVLGIINTLVLSVLERTRELGLLRAIGLRRGQTMRMITVESMVISLFGALLGVGVGVGLGAAIVRALKDSGFSEFALPWTLMAVYIVAGAVVGVVAAVIPAIRAARLNVLNAIAYE